MKVQEVLLRAMAKKITWWQAAEVIGVSARTMRRWRERLEQDGYDGLFGQRRRKRAYAGPADEARLASPTPAVVAHFWHAACILMAVSIGGFPRAL